MSAFQAAYANATEIDLTLLWDALSRCLLPSPTLTDADAYRLDTPRADATAFFEWLVARDVIVDPGFDDFTLDALDPRILIASAILQRLYL